MASPRRGGTGGGRKPPSGPRTADGERPDVVAVLRAHRLAPRTAAAIVQLGQQLRARTVETGVEFGALLTLGTGRQVGRTERGSSEDAPVGDQLQRMQRGR